jgi:uncharacterized protein involved in exopolysaccharide biosynthesis
MAEVEHPLIEEIERRVTRAAEARVAAGFAPLNQRLERLTAEIQEMNLRVNASAQAAATLAALTQQVELQTSLIARINGVTMQ